MKITNQIFNDVIIKDCLNDSNTIELDQTLNQTQIQAILNNIIEYESIYVDKNIKILISVETEKLLNIFKYIFNYIKNDKDIRNISLLTNLLLLIRPYNTFEDDFFQSNDVFISDIEQFIDIKSNLQEELSIFSKDIIEVFLSLCKSSTKFEYVDLDQYEQLPKMYEVLFLIVDFNTIIEIMSSFNGKYEFIFKGYKNAYQYIKIIFDKYKISSQLIDAFLNKIKK